MRDPELQLIAPADQAGTERVAKLVQVWHRDGTPSLVLVHGAIQRQREGDVAERMFCSHARLFARERLPVVSLAVLGDKNPSWRPDHLGAARWGCDRHLRFPAVNVRDRDAGDLVATPNPVALLTLLHRAAQELRGQPAEQLRRTVARERARVQQGSTASAVRILLRLMAYLLRRDPTLARLPWDQMQQGAVEVDGMEPFVTSFVEIGWEAGRIEGQAAGLAVGYATGLAEGQRTIVLRLLERTLGALPVELQVQITALTTEQLLHLSDALLDFSSVADLIMWLAQQRGASGVEAPDD